MKEVYQNLCVGELQGIQREDDGIYKCIWSVRAPSKALAYTWRIMQDRIQSRGNLLRRNIAVLEGNYNCPICNSELQTTSHALFECTMVYDIWMQVYKWLGISTALPKDPATH